MVQFQFSADVVRKSLIVDPGNIAIQQRKVRSRISGGRVAIRARGYSGAIPDYFPGLLSSLHHRPAVREEHRTASNFGLTPHRQPSVTWMNVSMGLKPVKSRTLRLPPVSQCSITVKPSLA